jgi:acetate kinase
MDKINGIIVINAGSSSLKFKLFNEATLKDEIFGQVTGIGTAKTKLKINSSKDKSLLKEEILDSTMARDDILVYLLQSIFTVAPEINLVAAGHRVVHGGVKYKAPTIIDAQVIEYLKTTIPLAPLHAPHNIRPMEVLQKQFPNIKQVACFDTAFHSTNPDYTRYYAIPRRFIKEDHIIRYGFHGLSYEYITRTLKGIDEKLYNGKVVVCHLGAGASLAAVVAGKGLTTTMGLTPLEGVPMGTRTGDIDPGVLLYLMKYKNYNYEGLEKLLWHESGMLGLSEESSDFYVVETSKNPQTMEAWKMFKFSLIKKIGSMITAMGGIDGIIFTAGVGENAPEIREAVAESIEFLGFKLNKEANNKNELVVSTPDSKIKMMVIPTNEELMIAENVVKLTK